MTTDEEKSRLLKLLQGLEPEIDVTRRCHDLVKTFKEKFGKVVEEEEAQMAPEEEKFDNPYVIDKVQLEETERKLKKLAYQRKKRETSFSIITEAEGDPKRPWRTNSHREKLLRIENELRRHRQKDSDAIAPLADQEMKQLVEECCKETLETPPVASRQLRDTIDAARKNLPNFQYRKMDNSTATAIFPDAHKSSDHYQSNNGENIELEL